MILAVPFLSTAPFRRKKRFSLSKKTCTELNHTRNYTSSPHRLGLFDQSPYNRNALVPFTTKHFHCPRHLPCPQHPRSNTILPFLQSAKFTSHPRSSCRQSDASTNFNSSLADTEPTEVGPAIPPTETRLHKNFRSYSSPLMYESGTCWEVEMQYIQQ